MISISEQIANTTTFDWYYTAGSSVAILLLLGIMELLKNRVSNRNTLRKTVHLGVGFYVLATLLITDSSTPILVLSASFALVNFWALRKRKFSSIHPDNESYGTVYYPVAIFILALFFWNDQKVIFGIATMVMVISDTLAAWVGEKFGQNHFTLLGEKKSFAGASAMLLSSMALLFIGLYFYHETPLGESILIAVVFAPLAMTSELLSVRGSDNLSIPLILGLFLFSITISPDVSLKYQIISGIFLSAAVVGLSFYLNFLTPSGGAATFVLGSVIFGLGGTAAAFPILFFFVSSSVMTKIGKYHKATVNSMYQKSGARDIYQVLANGGVAGILVILWFLTGYSSWYIAFLASVAAASADTWATEIGFYSSREPRLITTLKRVPKGTSGAVSPLGVFSGLIAGLAVCGIAAISGAFNGYNWEQWLPVLGIVTISGVAGSLFDSVLGALVQGRYICAECTKSTESAMHCGQPAKLVGGYAVFDNDVVNILSIIFASVVSLLLYFLIY